MSMLTLVGCDGQPQSISEQQVEDSDDDSSVVETAVASQDGRNTVLEVQNLLPLSDITSRMMVSEPSSSNQSQVSPEEFATTIARVSAKHPQCQQDDISQDDKSDCQYFELNTLNFSPKQPWLTSIMWQSIAFIVNPEMPLASQDGEAKNTIFMMLNKIEYGDKTAVHLPKYQHIMTDFQPDKVGGHTGYLKILSTQQRNSVTPKLQNVYYVMVDMDKKIRLNLEDILKPNHHPEELLAIIQKAGDNLRVEQGAESMQSLPVHLASQWYLDKDGLHFIYQPGETIMSMDGMDDMFADNDGFEVKPVASSHTSGQADIEMDNMPAMMEIQIPPALLSHVIKPQYLISTVNDNKVNDNSTANTQSADIIVKAVSPVSPVAIESLP